MLSLVIRSVSYSVSCLMGLLTMVIRSVGYSVGCLLGMLTLVTRSVGYSANRPKTSFEKNCFSAWASTLNMGLINKVDMVCLSSVGYGV